MPNTITRYRKDAGLTEQQLADAAGVSRDYIVKLEQTMYATPSGKVLEVLSDLTYSHENDIELEYLHEYKIKPSQLPVGLVPNWRFIKDVWRSEYHTHPDRNPHRVLREIIAREASLPGSQIKWAKWGNIHPAVLNKYELGKTTRMPVAVRDCLINLGATADILSELNEAIKSWCEDD